MANDILTIDMITRESLLLLRNNLGFTRAVNREYDSSFAQSGAKIGDTLRVRLPNRYEVSSGPTLVNQDVEEEKVDVRVDQQRHVGIRFTSAELTLDMDDFSSRILQPAMSRLASEIDFLGLQQYRNIYNTVGTVGTTPAAALTYLDAGVKLDNNAVPRDGNRHMVVNPRAQAATVDGLKGLFNQQSTIGNQFMRGTMGEALGWKWAMDQNVNRHTSGVGTGSPTVNGAGQTGASLVTTAWTASTTNILRAGDVFTIAGVFSVNPETGQSSGELAQFVATADVNSAGAGAATIPIAPAIITTGAKQTVTASPAAGAAITVIATGSTQYPNNMAFHRDAFVLGSADLEMPSGVDIASRQVFDGISLRIVRQYDINNDRFPCRVDVLFGWSTVRPEMACRVVG